MSIISILGEFMQRKRIRLMCISGVLTALVFVVTAYLHIPTLNGYVHVGDGLIYLAACILPWQYAVLVGAGGVLLADCLTGYAIWAPGSVVIKALTVLLFTSRGDKILGVRNLIMLIPASLVCAGGYYLYEALLYGNFIAPLAGILASLMQSLASSILFVAVGIGADRMRLKPKLNGGF